MAAMLVHCKKLGRELPGLDPDTPEGGQAVRMALLLGGPDLRRRVVEQISAEAWRMWLDHMRMVINEFRLDPTSDESNAILRDHLEGFLFGAAKQIPNYVPPTRK